MKRRRLVVVLLLSLLAYPLSAGSVIFSHTSVYKGRAGIAPVRGEMELERSGDGSWRYTSKVELSGWLAWKKGEIVETSEFRMVGPAIEAVSYEKKDDLNRKDRNVATRFDDDKIASRYRGQDIGHETDGPVYDLLSLRLAITNDLSRDRLQTGYTIVDGKGRVRQLEVLRSGEESVRTGHGRKDTVRLEYHDDEKRFLLWFAPDLHFQLVRIEQYKEGRLKAWMVLDQYRPQVD